MTHLLKVFLLIFISLVASSCKQEKKMDSNALVSSIEKYLGTKLSLPNDLIKYEPFSKNQINDTDAIQNSEFKIYSLINASCGTCINSINFWNEFALSIKKYNVPVILICYTDDNFELFKFYCESGEIKTFPYPFFLDSMNTYSIQNTFVEENKSFRTVLTDRNNKILLIGDPSSSKGMQELYVNEIKKHKSIY